MDDINELEATFYLAIVVCYYDKQVLPFILVPSNNFISLEEIVNKINFYGIFFLILSDSENISQRTVRKWLNHLVGVMILKEEMIVSLLKEYPSLVTTKTTTSMLRKVLKLYEF